ncbi:NAD-dependent protein deacetylase sirtuin-3, mitochondrial isoform X2 [Hyla sarda]|uniref:NAD-dependent protein deacetylase sirtuin-3, mitochondrial isoform X2 n=1 Tax=Hyla sarda TaxID=327740 RepID=UPI0024C41753|nr:NAD-dependent protein deacetylase sirtuin-3, mitochondrial isoform X2 [Hyla sarda]
MALLGVSYQPSFKKMVLVTATSLQLAIGRRIHVNPYQLLPRTGRNRISPLTGCTSGFNVYRRQVLVYSTKSSALSLVDVAEKIKKGSYRHILVMAGAGISTDSGIPDFRSPTNGLYSKLQEYSLPYPEAIFDLSYFLHDPKPFLRLSQELLPGRHHPNSAHYFLRLLHDKGLLLRLYTQNIDGLERAAGIPAEKLVEAHGTFASSTCTMCLKEYPGENFCDAVMKSDIPRCSSCGGLIKPDIVFFGEQLPARFFLHLTDFPRADLLFVMGTSLEVILTKEKSDGLNVLELGDVTRGVKHLVQLLGWDGELEELEKN